MYVQRGPHFQCAVLLWGTVFPVHDIAVKPISVPAALLFDGARACIGKISSALLARLYATLWMESGSTGPPDQRAGGSGSAQSDGHCAAWRGAWYTLGAPI